MFRLLSLSVLTPRSFPTDEWSPEATYRGHKSDRLLIFSCTKKRSQTASSTEMGISYASHSKKGAPVGGIADHSRVAYRHRPTDYA